MARRVRNSYLQDDGGFDLTSLLDVIFNLLFFFMVATHIRQQQHSLEVTLPTASEGRTVTEQQLLPEIRVAQNGAMSLNGETLDAAALEQRLQEWVKKDPKVRVVLSADAQATVQHATTALDVARKAGITQVIQRVAPAR